MSADEIARLDRIEAQQAEILNLLRGGASMRVAYTAREFGQLVGRSSRWVAEQVEIGLIARVRRMGCREILIPASEVERFRTGRAKLV